MSSTLYLINWAPEDVTPSLNNKDLVPLKASQGGADRYYPYETTVPRDASVPGEPGMWGKTNNLVIKPTGGGTSQIYNNLDDPQGAAPNSDLFLWIFPDSVVFSQFDDQLDSPVPPSSA